MRRGSPFSYIFRGDSLASRAYGFAEDEWNFSSGSEDEEE